MYFKKTKMLILQKQMKCPDGRIEHQAKDADDS